MCSECQSHLLKGWLFGDGGWWFSPSNITLQKRALSATYRILHRENTHSQTHACIIPLYTPPCVARLCFCLCKITVVQVSSRQSDADRQACERTAKHLCLPQRSFLFYNWLSCPACGFGYKTRSSRGSRLHLPEEQQRTMEGAFQDERQSGFLFQRAADVHGSWIPVLAAR